MFKIVVVNPRIGGREQSRHFSRFHSSTADYLPTEDLDAEVRETRELLLALARRVHELAGAANEQDRLNAAKARSGVRMHLSTAATELGEVIAYRAAARHARILRTT